MRSRTATITSMNTQVEEREEQTRVRPAANIKNPFAGDRSTTPQARLCHTEEDIVKITNSFVSPKPV